MPDQDSKDKPVINTEYSGIPLYETVKSSLFINYWEALELMTKINRYRVSQPNISDSELGRVADDFRAKVLQLYVALRPKLHYQKHKVVYEDIRQLDPDGFMIRPHIFSVSDAIDLLSSLGEFLEEDGVTKFEQKQFDPGHSFVGGLE